MRTILVTLFQLTTVLAVAQSTTYFQQQVDYTIEVTLNDKDHSLSGNETFEYKNNSTQSLDKLFIHLWPNAYKNAKTAMSKQKFRQGDFFMLWAKPTAKGYIDKLDFTVDGAKARWEFFEEQEDIAVLYLDKPLQPGGSITVATPFFVKLPSGSISRLGHIEESYQITQWYPKPAVFDNAGWHPMSYLTQGEFYSEFGSFDVKITLPENYTVGATGDLQTSAEIDRLNRLATEEGPTSMDFPASSATMKTLHYKQKNVHDFGWFADKRWIVRKGEMELPQSKRKVTTWAMFTPKNRGMWEEEGLKSIRDGLYYYSLWSGDYPYDVCTAVDGTISAGGGMEYPNVTVIGNSGDVSQLRTVIIHEVGHNWFYGILGSNERDHAWMDEGINSFFETRTILATRKDSGSAEIGLNIQGLNVQKALGIEDISYNYLTEELPYLIAARFAADQPIEAGSDDYTNLNYGGIVYKKTALAFNYLMQYLGEEGMNACMAAYFEAWKFKHPQPKDIREVFERVSGKNLSWFFDDLVQTTKRVDYSLRSAHKNGNDMDIKVRNTGEMASPFGIEVMRNGKTVRSAWFDGIEPGQATRITLQADKGDILKINSAVGIPEYNRNNNTLRTEGAFKTVEPVRFKFLSSIDHPDYSQLFWIPLVGWNEYNKWMLGVSVHNQTLPRKHFQWQVSPMYSFVNGTLNGFGSMEYDNGRMGAGVQLKRFAHGSFPFNSETHVRSYDVIAPYLRAKLFANRVRKDWSGEARLTYYSIGEMVKDTPKPIFSDYTVIDQVQGKGVRAAQWRGQASIQKKFTRSVIRFNSLVEIGDFTDNRVVHQHSLEHDWVYYGKGKKKIKSRLYAASSDGFYLNAAGQFGGSRYNSDSPYNSLRGDYLYEGLFLGRDQATGLMSQQFMRTQGGLAAPTAQSASRSLFSLNVEIELPVKLPLALYGGVAALKNERYIIGDGNENDLTILATNINRRWLFNGGVSASIIPNVLKVYIPIVYSQSIKDEVDARELNFGQTIMFEFNIATMNPFRIAAKNINP